MRPTDGRQHNEATVVGRRGFMTAGVVGSALALSSAASTAGVPVEPRQGDPWAPWQALPTASDLPDIAERAVAFGMLAPNVQNLQPWIVERHGADALIVYADLSRRLPVSDPPDRQLTVSFGTFLELMAIGMSTQGVRLATEEFPDGAPEGGLDRRPVLRIRLIPDTSVPEDPLAKAILARSTNRLPFDSAPRVTRAQLDAVREAAHDSAIVAGTSAPAEVARIRSIAHDAYVLETSLDPLLREIANTTRIGAADVAAYRWGPDMLSPSANEATNASLRRGLYDRRSQTHKTAVAAYLKAVDTGHAYVWVATPDNSRHSMLRAGRAWARMHLAATAIGLKMHPHSQSLHDYPEITSLKRTMHEALGVSSPGRVQMLGRIGYAAMAPHSPREPAGNHFTS